jgi:DedD protein
VPEKKVATAPVVPATSEERFVVQVGAYAEQTRAREARLKLERAGIKTYTQVVENKEGRRIRVRAGPFTSRAQAEREAEKIKKLDLPASVLTL